MMNVKPAPSGSLALLDYAPEIADNDDRVREIAETLHRVIKEEKLEQARTRETQT